MPTQMQDLTNWIEWSAYWRCYTVQNGSDERIAIIAETDPDLYVVQRLGCVDVAYSGTLTECKAFAYGLASDR